MKRCVGFLLLSLIPLVGAASTWPPSGAAPARAGRGGQKVSDEAARQIEELVADKRARTPAQKKIDSQLLYALKQKRGETRAVPTGRIDIQLDAEGRALVDVSAKVSRRLIAKIESLGGAVVSKSEKYHTVRAVVALEQLEALAGMKDVKSIRPAARATTNRGATTN